MSQTFKGGCLCGAVRYTIAADALFAGKCYCNECRKATGSGHNAVFAVPEGSVQITGKLAEYTQPGGSGQPFTRRFCPTCGSRISGSGVVLPGITLIAASSLDDPKQYSSQMSVYTAEAAPWDRPPVDSPAFPGRPPQA